MPDHQLFRKVDPGDIKQGYANDCYFLSTISAIAEFPDRIKALFLTKEINPAGCYAVELFVMGEKRTVVVDDRFPYDRSAMEFAFARPSS
jgi:calpain-15